MANPINPNDPYRPNGADDEMTRRADRLEKIQPDPQLAEAPANGGRIAMAALGIAVILGAVFYGLNAGSMNPADSSKSATQSAPAVQDNAQTTPRTPTNNIADSKPPVSPGVRDVTPHNNQNNQPGVTTGAAPSRPQPPANGRDGADGGTRN
ncbi:hypothetical protein [Rhodopseudomonas sp. P2A-2r]|uniref:hypothetical protein n=1 Tax=unclassified Rhodopseudomonas TaxID=2638247 RepID=UPI002234A083|nr:hypothetical protein [Rhodopseudomonas sp. P2A-2r]UZE51677.1 hypothetical protein ONR75_14475 [Rhodopseudomonas sp. P2A-2r]